MPYDPKPIDTSKVELDPKLGDLIEHLARDVHDRWAVERLRFGWRHGSRRDDEAKEHPGLVPYESLAAEEKEIDRQIASGVLRAIAALGYEIGARRVDASGATEMLGDVSLLDATALFTRWQRRELEPWRDDPESHCRLARRALNLGDLLSFDILWKGLKRFEGNRKLLYLLGLALARNGLPDRANEIARTLIGDELAKSEAYDEDVLCLLPRTHKDLAAVAAEPAEKDRQRRSAFEGYRAAYRRTGGYYPAINAATMATYVGEHDESRVLAAAAEAECVAKLAALPPTSPERYWVLATLGEAALLLNKPAAALRWYGEAAVVGGIDVGDLGTTRRQARMIAGHLGLDLRHEIDGCFPIPAVYVFAGHMIDQLDRRTPRFLPALEDIVRDEIRTTIAAPVPPTGFASAACGADILFLEAVRDATGTPHIVLPYAPEEFRRDSVDIVPGGRWGERFDALVAAATASGRLTCASDHRFPLGSAPAEYASRLLLGLALLRARDLDQELKGLVVWDRRSGDGPGGTATIVAAWEARGVPHQIIELDTLLARTHFPPVPGSGPVVRPPVRPTSRFAVDVVAVLFADMVGFSRLRDVQIPAFVQHVLGAIARLITEITHGPIGNETRGDGVYLVFRTVRDAGLFALALMERVAAIDWTSQGLPRDLSLRVALHSGPVYALTDPVTRLQIYTGAHVVRAARIEPITPPGHVYASHAFAALAVADEVTEFICEPVGRIALAKGYGVVPLFHVRRNRLKPSPRAGTVCDPLD